jgi:hypothetical protein
MKRTGATALAVTALGCGLACGIGCGARPDIWSQPTGGDVHAFGLAASVALVDVPAHRVVALTAGANQELTATRLETGHGVLAFTALPDGSQLYVLSGGHRAALGDSQPDEAPRLTIVGVDSNGTPQKRDIDLGGVLTDPLNGLAVDATGHWAVLYASGSGAGATAVTNPNELVIVDLTAATPPVPHTLHSFGGRPRSLVFTQELSLPVGPRHLLVVVGDQDLALLALETPDKDEITVRLSDPTQIAAPHPVAVVVDDGDPTLNDDARIGVRFDQGTGVTMLQLVASTGGAGNGFTPTVNIADVGGVASDIAFVRTDGGLRLAALVTSTSSAVLVDPVTSVTTTVALPARYEHLSLVTAAASGGTASTDVALLWGGDTSAGVAFWQLGQAAGRPFASIETVGVTASVAAVLDVPAPHATLKVLKTVGAGSFYVLDLGARTAAPLLTASSNVSLSVSPAGERVWSFAPAGEALGATDLATYHVRTLAADTPINEAFEIARADGGRALVALHEQGGIGATVFDAESQDEATRRIYGALLTEGPYDNVP